MTPTVVVLAAGSSERMGRPKMLLPYGSATILESTLAAIADSAAADVVVVVGAAADDVQRAIEHTPVRVVRNADHLQGNMSSLLTATDHTPDADAFILVPGDQPALQPSTIDAHIAAWSDRTPWAAVTAYRDRIGHPFLLSAAAVDHVRPHTGSKVLWHTLVASGDERVEHIAITTPAPLDVNTPDDYEKLRANDA